MMTDGNPTLANVSNLEQRYQAVRAHIDAAIRAAGRPPGSVRLLAVSKTQGAAAVRAVYGLGQRDFGENYAQELVAKAAELRDLADLRFAFIGVLQSNKIAAIVGAAAEIQSLASERHARLVARQAAAQGRAPYPVHILVNAGDEASKHGLAPAAVGDLARLISAELPELRLRGVMAIPPPPSALAMAQMQVMYRGLRQLADQVGEGDLSLGMTHDLEAAIEAGSNCVRIGTGIFGERPSRG